MLLLICCVFDIQIQYNVIFLVNALFFILSSQSHVKTTTNRRFPMLESHLIEQNHNWKVILFYFEAVLTNIKHFIILCMGVELFTTE